MVNLYERDGGSSLGDQYRERALAQEKYLKGLIDASQVHDKLQWMEMFEDARKGSRHWLKVYRKARGKSAQSTVAQVTEDRSVITWENGEGQTRAIIGVVWRRDRKRFAVRICTKMGDYINSLDCPQSPTLDEACALAMTVDYLRLYLFRNRWLKVHRWRDDQWNDPVLAKCYPEDIELDHSNKLHRDLSQWMGRKDQVQFDKDSGRFSTLRDYPSESLKVRLAMQKKNAS